MGRSQNLRQNMINQFIDDLNCGHIPSSPLPSQSSLAEMYGVSRTTIRHILEHLCQRGVLTVAGSDYTMVRKPDTLDGFVRTLTSLIEQNNLFERMFNSIISQYRLHPGEIFTEIYIARITGVSTVIVQEFLLKLRRYNLVENEKPGYWKLKHFDISWINQLFELRELLETHALQHFLNLPDDDHRWIHARMLLEQHRIIRNNINETCQDFAQLDSDFHLLLMSAANNIFFDQSVDVLSTIFHFHYQWDTSELKQRHIVAIEEHIMILGHLICRNDVNAHLALRGHLETAKKTMIRLCEPKKINKVPIKNIKM